MLEGFVSTSITGPDAYKYTAGWDNLAKCPKCGVLAPIEARPLVERSPLAYDTVWADRPEEAQKLLRLIKRLRQLEDDPGATPQDAAEIIRDASPRAHALLERMHAYEPVANWLALLLSILTALHTFGVFRDADPAMSDEQVQQVITDVLQDLREDDSQKAPAVPGSPTKHPQPGDAQEHCNTKAARDDTPQDGATPIPERGAELSDSQDDKQPLALLSIAEAQYAPGGTLAQHGVMVRLTLAPTPGSDASGETQVRGLLTSPEDALLAAETLRHAGMRALNGRKGRPLDEADVAVRRVRDFAVRGDTGTQTVALRFDLLPLGAASDGPEPGCTDECFVRGGV